MSYDELVKELREVKDSWQTREEQLMLQAADAIEELQQTVEHYKGCAYDWYKEACDYKAAVPQWTKIKSRPMDEEERRYYSEHYGYNLTDDEAVIYCCQLPKHGQEVLVCNKYWYVWIDTFVDDPDYGVGFETNGDMDGIVAWMPIPEPPKEVEE